MFCVEGNQKFEQILQITTYKDETTSKQSNFYQSHFITTLYMPLLSTTLVQVID